MKLWVSPDQFCAGAGPVAAHSGTSRFLTCAGRISRMSDSESRFPQVETERLGLAAVKEAKVHVRVDVVQLSK